MTKSFAIFGATGSQGGSIVTELLRSNNKYSIRAITRDPKSSKAQNLEADGAKLVQADMNDLESLKTAVKGANIIFAITDFISAGSLETEVQHGINILDAALSTLDTLETFIWSNLPDARAQHIAYQNVIHFNSKDEISKRMRASALGKLLTEVRVGAYYENLVKAPQVYGPQKLPDGSWQLMLPIHAHTTIPFTHVGDLGRLVGVIVGDKEKFRTKSISVVSQKVTPIEMLKSWNEAVGLDATFKSLSTEEFTKRLETVHHFPSVFAVALAENLSVVRDAPGAWVDGTDFTIEELVPNLKTWDEYVQEEDWDVFFKAVDTAKLF